MLRSVLDPPQAVALCDSHSNLEEGRGGVTSRACRYSQAGFLVLSVVSFSWFYTLVLRALADARPVAPRSLVRGRWEVS